MERLLLPIDMRGLKPIPTQDLEGKLGHIAVIKSIERGPKDIVYSPLSTLTVENSTGTRSRLALPKYFIQELFRIYGVKKPSKLIGKPVISIYSLRDGKYYICGVVPITASGR